MAASSPVFFQQQRAFTSMLQYGATGRTRTGTTEVEGFSYHYSFHYQFPVCGLDYTLTICQQCMSTTLLAT